MSHAVSIIVNRTPVTVNVSGAKGVGVSSHAGLSGKNDEADVQHLTAAQVALVESALQPGEGGESEALTVAGGVDPNLPVTLLVSGIVGQSPFSMTYDGTDEGLSRWKNVEVDYFMSSSVTGLLLNKGDDSYHATAGPAAGNNPVNAGAWAILAGAGQPAITGDAVVATHVGQWCRVGDAAPFDWYQWNGSLWVYVRTDGSIANTTLTGLTTFATGATFSYATAAEQTEHLIALGGGATGRAVFAAATGDVAWTAMGKGTTANGAVSSPAASFTGTWYSGGTATTTKPYFLIEPAGTTSTGWSTTGTGLGINSNLPESTTTKILDCQTNGVSKFYVDTYGRLHGSAAGGLRIYPHPSGNQLILNGDRATWEGSPNCTIGINSAFFQVHSTLAQVWCVGVRVNAAPTHQCLQAHDGISGTNREGANFNIAGGSGTGSGRGGDLIDKTAESGASGTTQNGFTTRTYHSAKPVDLTGSTATTVCNVALAASKYFGLKMVCTVTSDDGTDFQALTSEVNISAVNKAGTVTTTITQVDGTTAASAGTLTCSYTAVANGNSVDIKANAGSSLTRTTLRAKWSIISLNTNSTDTSVVAGSVVTPS